MPTRTPTPHAKVAPSYLPPDALASYMANRGDSQLSIALAHTAPETLIFLDAALSDIAGKLDLSQAHVTDAIHTTDLARAVDAELREDVAPRHNAHYATALRRYAKPLPDAAIAAARAEIHTLVDSGIAKATCPWAR